MNSSTATKIGVHFGLYCTTLLKLGTKKHFHLVERGYALKDLGCYLMTEIGHGSNVQGIVTTATYNHANRSFIINTPHEIGIKYWIGNLGRTANSGLVFANLIVNKHNYGIHVFLVPIRNQKGKVTRGITLGDCGPKLGMNGVDNGWASFNRVEIPYFNLLDKYSQINEKGEFCSSIKKKSKRFTLQLSALSGGRLMVGLSSIVTSLLTSGLVTRFVSVRKQFGTKKYQENTTITYPLVQEKLIPPISRNIVLMKLHNFLDQKWFSLDITQFKDPQVKNIHALCSFLKSEASWNC